MLKCQEFYISCALNIMYLFKFLVRFETNYTTMSDEHIQRRLWILFDSWSNFAKETKERLGGFLWMRLQLMGHDKFSSLRRIQNLSMGRKTQQFINQRRIRKSSHLYTPLFRKQFLCITQLFFSESCTIQCQNGGFPIKPLSGICKCKCPSGLKGDYCEQVEKSASNYQVAITKK